MFYARSVDLGDILSSHMCLLCCLVINKKLNSAWADAKVPSSLIGVFLTPLLEKLDTVRQLTNYVSSLPALSRHPTRCTNSWLGLAPSS
jgi:hypothetical protein